MDISDDRDALRALLESARRIAVVGSSPNPRRDSLRHHEVPHRCRLRRRPRQSGAGRDPRKKCYPSLAAVPGPVDIVDIFRRPEHVPAIVDEAIASRAGSVWMQLGVGNPEAARRASDAGLQVVADRCIKGRPPDAGHSRHSD